MGGHCERAERHLFGLVRFASSPLPRDRVARALSEAKRRARMAAAAETFVELGVLGEADVAPVRGRLEAAIASRGCGETVLVDEDVARRARGLLERRLGEVAENPDLPRMPAQLEHPPASDPVHGKAVDRFQALHAACAGCGALSDEELSDWNSRLLEVDDGRTWHLERERRQKRCTLAELRAVVRGRGDHAGALRISTAELYSDGVILRWHETGGSLDPHSASAAGREARRRVLLTDDLATEYLHFHTNESHTGASVLWTAAFATAVPQGARELVADIRDERFRLPLAAGAGDR